MKNAVIVMLIAIALGSCAMGGTYSVSEPFMAEASGYRVDPDGTFHADGIVYRVTPLNYKPEIDAVGPIFPIIPIMCCRKLDHSGQDFHIAIYFYPQRDEFTITPAEMVLEINGSSVIPTATGGPFPCMADEAHHTQCIYEEQELTTSNLSRPVPIGRGSYMLVYPVVTPTPKQPFSIRISGLRRNGQSLSPSQINFKAFSHGYWFLFAGP